MLYPYILFRYFYLKTEFTFINVKNLNTSIETQQSQKTQMEFNKNLDDIVGILSKRKDNIVHFLKKHFIENKDFITSQDNENKTQTRGGHNKVSYLMTENTYDLLETSYNLKHKYVPVVKKLTQCMTIMTLENQTIGFIWNVFKTFNIERQKMIGKYHVDLYFHDYKIVVECDELGHKNRDQIYEKVREDYLVQMGNTMIRFNPNKKDFDLSNIMHEIVKIIFKSK